MPSPPRATAGWKPSSVHSAFADRAGVEVNHPSRQVGALTASAFNSAPLRLGLWTFLGTCRNTDTAI